MFDTNVCLSCLVNENIFNIYEIHECEGNEEIYNEMLKSCFGIEISKESVAHGMCEKCILTLREAYFFKQNILKNIEVLESQVYKEFQLDPKTGHFIVNVKKEIIKIENKDEYAITDKNIQKQDFDENESSINETKESYSDMEAINSDFKDENSLLLEREDFKMNQDSNPIIEIMICDVCNKQFTCKKAMERHTKTHLEGNFLCGVCNQAFTKLNSRNAHVWRVHHTREPYGCTKCGERFQTFHQRLCHIKEMHNLKPTYKCPHCDKVYFEAGSRSKHVRSTHLKIRNHKCTECIMAFFKRRELLNHLATVHGIGEKEHVCDICRKSFFRQATLKMHLKTHQGKDGNAKFRCEICDSQFTIKTLYKNHMMHHKKGNPSKEDSLVSIGEEQVIVEDQIIDGSNDTVYFDIGDETIILKATTF